MEELERQKRITKELRSIEVISLIILLIHIIISIIGTIVVNNIENNNCSSNVNIEEYQKELFNSRFFSYIGTGRNYATAKSCITAINVCNGTNNNEHIVNCETSFIDLKKNKTYTIDYELDSDGYINYITITEEGE